MTKIWHLWISANAMGIEWERSQQKKINIFIFCTLFTSSKSTTYLHFCDFEFLYFWFVCSVFSKQFLNQIFNHWHCSAWLSDRWFRISIMASDMSDKEWWTFHMESENDTKRVLWSASNVTFSPINWTSKAVFQGLWVLRQ